MENKQISKRIKDLLREKGIPISRLLSDLGINKGFMYDLERRKVTPSAQIVQEIADYLKVTADYLMGRDVDEGLAVLAAAYCALPPQKKKQALDYVTGLQSENSTVLVAARDGGVTEITYTPEDLARQREALKNYPALTKDEE